MMPEGSRKVCVLNGSRQIDNGKGVATNAQAAHAAPARTASKGHGASM
ncbi:hypothetical protein [Escherichia coli]